MRQVSETAIRFIYIKSDDVMREMRIGFLAIY